MRRISITAALAAVGVLALVGTASADIGDIRGFEVRSDPEGTAEAAQVTGIIRCTTTIDYGLVGKVAQDPDSGTAAASSGFGDDPTGASGNDADVEGVAAFGPNAGNEANTPCSTNLQNWEVVIQRNRDSGTYDDGPMGQLMFAGTSANDGDRGPGPFIGDLEYAFDDGTYTRTDP